MKFLCDNCKAKYQIADDKVQGKTLRMKCRKCGHTIEIRALEGGAAPSTAGETMQVTALSEEAAAHLNLDKPAAPRPAAGAPAAPRAAAPTAPAAPAAPRPTTGAAPRPTTAAAPRPTTGVAPRPTTETTRGTGPTAPRPTTGTGPAVPGAVPRAGAAPAPKPEGSALANAFKKSVDDAPPPSTHEPSPHGMGSHGMGSSNPGSADPPAEEWYAAIDDVPVGPIRLAELRAKYTQGGVHDGTLVWREGFEEWRPLVTLTDLHRLVKEEVSGAMAPRSSLLPNGPQQGNRSSARPAGPTRGGGAPMASPRAPVVQPSRSNVIPFDRAAARKLDDDLEDLPTQIASAPLLAPTPEPAAAAHDDPFAPAVAAVAKSDPFVSDPFAPKPPATAFAPAGPAPSTANLATVPLDPHAHRETMLEHIAHKTGVSKGIAGLVAAACLLLGVVIAVLVVGRKTVVQERIVEKTVAGPTVTVTVTVPGAAVPAPVASASTDPGGSKVAVKSGGGTPAPGATTAAPTNTGIKGLDLGPAGPDVPGASTGGGGGGGGGEKLAGSQVETVVGSKRTSVRKTCYEPYSDKGSATAKIRLNINADGSVSSVDLLNTTGDSAIGSCVQKLAKGWRFPVSGSGGTFDVPFFFGT